MTLERRGCRHCNWHWIHHTGEEELVRCPACGLPLAGEAPPLIATAWQAYVALKLDSVGEEEIERCRRAFYAGAQALTLALMQGWASGGEDEALHRAAEEVETFFGRA